MDENLELIASRLTLLLTRSDDPEAEMGCALSALEERGLWNGSMIPATLDRGRPPFYAFAQNVIVENHLLKDALAQSSREFHPVYCETVEELISALLPSDGHLD